MGLVLSRKLGESIRIADDIKITIVERRGEVVRVNIDAPRDIPVHREEIFAAGQLDASRPGSQLA